MKWTGVGLFLLDRWIVVHLHFLQKHLFKCRICSSIFFHAFVQPLSWFKCSTDFCHVRPNSVTCSPLSSPAMVPYVCKNVYAVCFFQPDLILCLLSNEPHSPRGSKLKPHAIYTDWTAGALLAKEVWVGERNYHGRFRLNQALVNSLCFFFQFFFKLSVFSFLPSFFSRLSGVATSGRVGFGSALYISFVMSLLLFLFTLQLMVPAHFPLWNALLNKEAGWAG